MTLQRFLDKDSSVVRLEYDLDEDDDAGFEPWALGDKDADVVDSGQVDEDGFDEADSWLDQQLGQLRGDTGHGRTPDATVPIDGPLEEDDPPAAPPGSGATVVLRKPAPARGPRRRHADPEAVADLPAAVVPGYVRDRRGTWRYAATGRAVPGARDLTLRSLYRFPTGRGHVSVPVDLVRCESELAWCLAWKHTMTTRLEGGRSVTALRVPVGEWERRADIPIGLWAPELTASRLLGIGDVAQIAGTSAATVSAYLARRRMPAPVMRIGNRPVWSRPVIRQWLAARPGQGVRAR